MPIGTHIHYGDHSSVPEDASAGLIFLKQLLPALDSLQPSVASVESLLCPDARFIINGGDAQKLSSMVPMLENRSKHLAKFQHTVHRAWDIESDENPDRRTLMYQSTSVTVFKADSEAQEIYVEEFSIVELVKTRSDKNSEGIDAWKAMELKTYMDAKPVVQRAEQLSKLA